MEDTERLLLVNAVCKTPCYRALDEEMHLAGWYTSQNSYSVKFATKSVGKEKVQHQLSL